MLKALRPLTSPKPQVSVKPPLVSSFQPPEQVKPQIFAQVLLKPSCKKKISIPLKLNLIRICGVLGRSQLNKIQAFGSLLIPLIISDNLDYGKLFNLPSLKLKATLIWACEITELPKLT